MHTETSAADAIDYRGGGTTPEALRQEPLVTVPLAETHRIEDFSCSKSERVGSFLQKEAPALMAANYCRVFILPNPDDGSKVWGYYTLSSAILQKRQMSGSDERRAPFGLDAPVVRIGFMGRDDTAPKG